MPNTNISVLILGTGPIGIEYSKICKDMGYPVVVVGRSESSCKAFFESTGITAQSGGIEIWLEKNSIQKINHAIVAVTENELGHVTQKCIISGLKDILVEKPGGANFEDIKKTAQIAEQYGARVIVGYNRRHYTSVSKAKEIIEQDGGVTSFNFEFTEWSHVISPLKKAAGVKEQWFLHNSTHIIDLAFYLGGRPKELVSYVSGSLPWHPAGSIFSGAGISESEALFSYQANWEAPGRWSVEMLTSKHRLILRPMEKLQIQNIGSVSLEEVSIDDSIDLKFKPGFFKQVQSFIDQSDSLCTIQEQSQMLKWYKKILNNANE